MITESVADDVVMWLSIFAALPAVAFTLVYGIGSPWWKSWLGRTVFGLMLSITLLFVVTLIRWFAGDYPGYHIVSVVVYLLLTIMFWMFFIILLVERRRPEPRPLELTLQRHPTQETPIVANKEN